MATRYERPEEWLPDLAKSMRRGVRDVQRPTGTERALTAETAERADGTAGEAVLAADAAATAALLAKTTADGRNRVFAAGVKPVAPADAPFVAGDLWYATDMLGRFVNVSVWSSVANDFVEHQMVASSVLVPGSVGNVLIANGAIDGKTITGATIRTAPSGQRMQFDVDGLASYDAGGTQTAVLSAAGSGMAMRDAGSNLVSLSPRFGLTGSVASDTDRLGGWTVNTNGLAIRKGAPEQTLQLEFLGPSVSPTSCRIFTTVPFAIQAPGDMSIATVGSAAGKRITIEHEFAKLSKVEMSSSEVLLNSISRGRLSFGDQATAQGGYIEGIGTGGGYKGGVRVQGGSNGVTAENGIEIKAGAGGDVAIEAASGKKVRAASPLEAASVGNLDGGLSAPYAMAAGIATRAATLNAGTGGTVAVTFPANRFTESPIVVMAASSGRITAGHNSVTKDGFTASFDNWSPAGAAGPIYGHWTATQMTKASASG